MTALREHIAERLGHVMWPKDVPDGERVLERATCSCGFETDDSMWHDDVIIPDIVFARPRQHADFLIAYPEGRPAPLETFGGVMCVVRGEAWPLSTADLEWLLAHDDLAEEFRRAAAVHLEPPLPRPGPTVQIHPEQRDDAPPHDGV